MIKDMELTEQQTHLQNLLEQKSDLEASIEKNRNLYLKVQGAIEYLTQVGVTLPEPEPEVETEVVEEVAEEG